MIRACDGGKVITPFTKNAKAELMFSENKNAGTKGQIIKITDDMLTSLAFGINENTYKYYFCRPISEGYCGYYNCILDKTLMLSYDPKKLPYLGVWINNGGFKGMYNIALEPCTAAFDRIDEARKRNQSSLIKAHDTCELCLDIDLH